MLGETNTGSYDAVSYTYNAIGNITSKTVGTDTFAYSYDGPQAHAVSKVRVNDTTDYLYDYDDNGNMTDGWNFANLGSVAARDMSYNADNKPVSIVMSGATTQFVYDGKGARAKKVVSGGSTTYYVGQHLEIKDTETIKYVFAGNTRIAKITSSDVYYFHKDHLGSSSVMTGATGAEVEATEYMPFGGQRDHTGTVVSDHKYTDQELDTSTGLYNYGARLYDPLIGRFISPDTIVQNPSDPQTLNRYTYCRNNPLIYVDPSGHSMISGLMAHFSSRPSIIARHSSGSLSRSSSGGGRSGVGSLLARSHQCSSGAPAVRQKSLGALGIGKGQSKWEDHGGLSNLHKHGQLDPGDYGTYPSSSPFDRVRPFWSEQTFGTQDAAAHAAMTNVLVYRSIATSREYAGLIYQLDGTYGYTEPRQFYRKATDLNSLVVPSGSEIVAYYHTHGAPLPFYDEEFFSQNDIDLATGEKQNRGFSVDAYLVTPSLSTKRYHYDATTKTSTVTIFPDSWRGEEYSYDGPHSYSWKGTNYTEQPGWSQ